MGNIIILSGGAAETVFPIVTDADDGFVFKTWVSTTETIAIGLVASTWRFQNITIPQGATIVSATFTATRSDADGNCSAIMTGDDVNNSPALSSSHNRFSGWTATSASQAMTGTTPNNPTCNVTAIIQEIIDRPGWSSGNALSLGADNTGDSVEVGNMTATLTVSYTS